MVKDDSQIFYLDSWPGERYSLVRGNIGRAGILEEMEGGLIEVLRRRRSLVFNPKLSKEI